ncbi:glucose 1-dehydrogenase [Dongia soli]|uniref:Glucose 1-dehydrogenase n=1 Tax=Dongia soli TaxID=600628 RepID=A0ABU5E7E8_9PROT|nr:glucose 1-dehydrogenase [Dongia soli]MDY0881555.1 glucose 1-dehydrogenase [Dongia soli]
MGRVDGKVALVTGAAMGLGQATAELLAREGAKVMVSDINEEQGRAVVKRITENGGTANFYRHDVGEPDQWDATIAEVKRLYGRLDILVNNAGICVAANIEDTTLEDWRWTMKINLDGVFLGTKAGVKLMKETRGGSIINLSSIDGIIGESPLAAYCASKGGVRLLTKAAALHCAQAGYKIRINSIHPGYIHTPQHEKYLRDLGDYQGEWDRKAKLHPLGHFGKPIDIANAVLFLASDESSFMTGSEMVVDGGYTAQ